MRFLHAGVHPGYLYPDDPLCPVLYRFGGHKWRDGTLAQHAVTILLAATLLIGACTPAMEIYRGICHIAKEGTFCLENEEPYTLADRPVSLNFETQNCENKLFFTYFAK